MIFNKKLAALLCAAVITVPAFAASTDEGETSSAERENSSDIVTTEGLSARVYFPLDFPVFRVTKFAYDRTDIRGQSYQDKTEIHGPINNEDFISDSYLQMTYNAASFGGNLRLSGDSISSGNFAYVLGWARLGFLKLTAGNDIASTYADSLGADPGLRLYTGTSNKENDVLKWDWATTNPDNITQSYGLLLEGFLGNLTLAAAAGDFDVSTVFTNQPYKGGNGYGVRQDQSYRYGFRAGYKAGDAWRFNASYYLKEKMIGNNYYFKKDSKEIVPFSADAESLEHNYGLYGTVYTPLGLDITAGYAGQTKAYLSEYYSNAANGNAGGFVETGYPLVVKHGLNLNARWKAIPDKLTLRTDHNLSLWNDKDYSSFQTSSSSLLDYGLSPVETTKLWPEVTHMVLYNNIVGAYELNEKLSVELTLNNRFGKYAAFGKVSGQAVDYSVTYNALKGKIQCGFKITSRAEIKAGIVVEHVTGVRSKGLNTEDRNAWFIANVNNDSVNGAVPAPVATSDSRLRVWVPISLSLTIDGLISKESGESAAAKEDARPTAAGQVQDREAGSPAPAPYGGAKADGQFTEEEYQ